MTHIKSILTAAALCAVTATGLQAQSTNPASAYNAKGLPAAEAVAAALAVKDNAALAPVDRVNALLYALGDRARDAALKELAPQLAARVVAGQELAGVPDVPARVAAAAHAWLARQLPTRQAQTDYLRGVLDAPGVDYVEFAAAGQQLVGSGLELANQLSRARDYAAAESVLTALLPHDPAKAIPPLVAARQRLGKHAEAQGLALVGWRIAGWQTSGPAEALLFSAVAADPAKGLSTANAGRAFINTGAGANPLADIAAPAVALKKVQTAQEEFLALTLAGDLDGAAAKADFILAESATVGNSAADAATAARQLKAAQDAASAIVLQAARNKAGTNGGPVEAKRAWLASGGASTNNAAPGEGAATTNH